MSTASPTVVTEFEAEVEVRKVRQVADEVVELTLTVPDGRALPDWTPGAHVDLILGDDLVRQYSLCSSPRDPSEYRVVGAAGPRQPGRLHPGARAGRRGDPADPRSAEPLPAGDRHRATSSSPAASG